MLSSPLHIVACATCNFDRTGEIGAAAEGSILFMIAVMFFMFGILGYTIFSFARKAKLAAQANPLP